MAKWLMVVLVALALAVTACGDDDDDGAAAPVDAGTSEEEGDARDEGDGEGADVTVEGFEFRPATMEVAAGATVTWTNDDGVAHTVTAGDPEEPTGDFDEPLPASGGTAEVTFDDPGTFAYFCSIHPEMTGEVVVS